VQRSAAGHRKTRQLNRTTFCDIGKLGTAKRTGTAGKNPDFLAKRLLSCSLAFHTTSPLQSQKIAAQFIGSARPPPQNTGENLTVSIRNKGFWRS